MAVGIICPTCGRSGAGKSNLISTLDKLTQDIYLQEEGFVFINPYWNLQMVPAFDFFNELIDELHSPTREFLDDNSHVKLTHFDLYRFDFSWIYSDSILCKLPFQGIEWFQRATFFIPSFNEDLPSWIECKNLIETAYSRIGWVRNPKTTAWEDKSKEIRKKIIDTEGIDALSEKMDEPNAEEMNFLQRTEELIYKYLNAFTHHENRRTRTVYSQDFLAKVKEEIKDYEANDGKWGGKVKGTNGQPLMVLDIYRELSRRFLYETQKLIKHIEFYLTDTKGEKDKDGKWKPNSYQLFLPTGITKINENRLMVSVERDFMSLWYPRLEKIFGNWKFQTRPLTKQMIEEFSETGVDIKDEKGNVIGKQKRPLQSCVFCPSDDSISPVSSDDTFFDAGDLVAAVAFDRLEYEGRISSWLHQAKEEQYKFSAEQAMDAIYKIVLEKKDELYKVEDFDLEHLINLFQAHLMSGQIGEKGDGANEERRRKCSIIIFRIDKELIRRVGENQGGKKRQEHIQKIIDENEKELVEMKFRLKGAEEELSRIDKEKDKTDHDANLENIWKQEKSICEASISELEKEIPILQTRLAELSISSDSNTIL